MINIFIAALTVVTGFSIFTITYKINGLNRTIVNAPVEIFEYALPYVSNDTDIDPTFSKETIKNKYESYLEKVIYNYVDSYEINYRFYNPEDNSICLKNCSGVEIYFSAELIFDYRYQRTMFYEVKKI